MLADGSIVTASERRAPRPVLGAARRRRQLRRRHRVHLPAAPGAGEHLRRADVLRASPTPRDLLRYFDGFIDDAPREYGGFPGLQIAPPLPFIPEDRVGEPFPPGLLLDRDHAEGEKVLQGFRDVGPVVAEHVGAMPYTALNALFDALLPRGLQHYWKAAFAGDLTDDVIAAHAEHAQRLPGVNSTMHLYPVNGAAHDVAPDATAWGHRDAKYATVIAGMWPDPADNAANIAWVNDYYAAIAPHSLAGGYVNFASGDDQAKVARQLRRQLRPAARGQAAVRPRQRVPPQPEHHPGLTWATACSPDVSRAGRGRTSRRRRGTPGSAKK